MNCRDSPNTGSPIHPGGRFSVHSLPELCFIILYKSTLTAKNKTISNIFFLYLCTETTFIFWLNVLKRATL